MHLPRRRSRRALFLGVYVGFCLGTLVAGERLFWWFRAAVPLTERARIWDIYYPEIRVSQVEKLHPRHDDKSFDVLMLGGSVITPEWGSVEKHLSERLREAVGDRFRVFNLARPSHTSRDSTLKYAHLENEQFEAVVVYNGINDVRMNCCTREQFRDDYTHFAWYYGLQKKLDRGEASLPANLAEHAVIFPSFLGLCCPPELAEEGHDIKTVGPVRRNLEDIVRTAARRGDTVVLQTYAYYLPSDYTIERFGKNALGYGSLVLSRCSVETWGKPENVSATLDAQNAAICELAEQNAEALLVDQRELMPNEASLYVDVCHLSERGAQRFVENLWPALEGRAAAWKREHGDGRK